MRNLSILLVMLLMWPCLARAIKPASSTEKIAIQDLIDQANEINKTSSSNPKVRDVEKLQQDLAREESQPEYLQNHGAIARLQVELKALKKKRDKLYLQAIRQTLIAYDLVDLDSNGLPIMPKKPAVHPLVKGRDVHWIVIYKDNEPRVLLDNGREAQTVPAGNKKTGRNDRGGRGDDHVRRFPIAGGPRAAAIPREGSL